MKLTVVGSADAVNAGGRGNSCYLLEGELTEGELTDGELTDGELTEGRAGKKLMVDFGPTALLGLRRVGSAPAELGGIVFTHLHGDHTGGFPLLCIETMFGGSPDPALRVLGPPLTRSTLASVFRASYGELEADLPTRIRLDIEEFHPGDTRRFAGFQIQAFAADHMAPPHQALCLRVRDAAGRTIAFSGDTRICPGLLAAADGADLLVADCSRLAPPAGPHATWQEWRQVLPSLRARSILMTHLGADVRAQVGSLLDGWSPPLPVAFADDGLIVEV